MLQSSPMYVCIFFNNYGNIEYWLLSTSYSCVVQSCVYSSSVWCLSVQLCLYTHMYMYGSIHSM